MTRTCAICPRRHYAYGYCESHAANYRRHGIPVVSRPRGLPLIDMLLARIPLQPTDGCWEWGGTMRGKYGVMKWHGKDVGAHQLMFFAVHGYFPAETRHTCDNPPCCRDIHLLNGDRQLNVNDRVERGRSARAPGRSNPNARYTAEQVAEVVRLWRTGLTGDQVAAVTGVNRNAVYRIGKGQR